MANGTTPQVTPETAPTRPPATASTGMPQASQLDETTKRLLSRMLQPKSQVQPAPGQDKPPAMMAPTEGVAHNQDEGRQMFVHNLFALIHNAGAAQKAQQLKHATGVLSSLNNSWSKAQELSGGDTQKAQSLFSQMPEVTHILEDKKNVKQLGKLLQFDFMEPEKKKTVWHEALGNVVEAGKQLPFIKQLTGLIEKHKQNQQTPATAPNYAQQEQDASVVAKQFAGQARGNPALEMQQATMALREQAWFRRGVALAPECNRHIVDASIKYLKELRQRTGFRHQLIAVACSVDHARQIRGLYEERKFRAHEIYSEMDKDKQEGVIADLRSGKLDCIVQVQMLGEGFDHPPLSVAAIFRPFASLSPYIQFIGRVMRVVHEGKADHPDNNAFVISHVGLNTDAHWDDFREVDLDDQAMLKKWLGAGDEEDDDEGGGEPRRFDVGMLVDNEIIGSFINRSFLDPEDDRVLDEMLDHQIGGGLRVRDFVRKEQLRETLRQKQAAAIADTSALPVQPQARRVQARKRLAQRTGSVVARILKELGLTLNGREVGKIIKKVAGQNNRAAVTKLLNTAINEHLGIASGSRRNPGADDNEDTLAALDMLGDQVRDSLKGRPAEDA